MAWLDGLDPPTTTIGFRENKCNATNHSFPQRQFDCLCVSFTIGTYTNLEFRHWTPGTAIRVLLPNQFHVYHGPSLSLRKEDVMAFSSILLECLAKGVDTKSSGGLPLLLGTLADP